MSQSDFVIDYFDKKTIRGWFRIPTDQEPLIYATHNNEPISIEPSFHSRPDLKEIPNTKAVGFTLQLKDIYSFETFINSIEVCLAIEGEIVCAIKHHTIDTARSLDSISPTSFSEGLRMLERSKKAGFATHLRDYFTPWRALEKKRKACVITYANSSQAWFSAFYQHYTNLLGENSIYVVTPNAANFGEYQLAGIITLPDAPYSDSPRAQLITGLINGLTAYYEYVFICDVDEFIIHNPKLGKNIFTILDAQPKKSPYFALGLDVIQDETEESFNPSQSILSQRKYGILNSAMCKPMIHSSLTRLCMGHHFCDKPTSIQPEQPLYYNLHMKYGCSKVRNELLHSLKHLTYEDKAIERYSTESLNKEKHPSQSRARLSPALKINSSEIAKFLNDWTSEVRQNEYTGHFTSDHRVFPRLIELSSITNV